MSTWFETDWGREQRQSRELEEFRDELSYASTQTGRLRSRLAQVTGSLEARVLAAPSGRRGRGAGRRW